MYKENPRIVRGFKRCFADEQRRAEKAKKKEKETEKEKKGRIKDMERSYGKKVKSGKGPFCG